MLETQANYCSCQASIPATQCVGFCRVSRFLRLTPAVDPIWWTTGGFPKACALDAWTSPLWTVTRGRRSGSSWDGSLTTQILIWMVIKTTWIKLKFMVYKFIAPIKMVILGVFFLGLFFAHTTWICVCHTCLHMRMQYVSGPLLGTE